MSRTKHILSYSIPIVILLFFLFGSFFAPHDPTATNIRGKYLSSSAEYPFGTDDFGRCEFSRILEGGKITLGIVLVGSAIVILLGIFFGILLAKTGRRRNILAESILNAVTAIPPVAYLIIFIGIWGNSIPTMLVALTASLVLRMIKLVKTLIEGEYDKAYIMCAIACGASKMRIMLVHILPNIIRDVVQFICLSCAEMIIAISGFSFIGLSLGDDVIDWGVMLSDARALAGTHLTVRRAWHTEHNRPVISDELKTKAAERNIPLPVCLAECLNAAKETSTSEYVVSNRDGEPLSYTQFKRLWQYIVTRTVKERSYYRYEDGKRVKHTVTPVLGEKAAHNGKVVYSLDFEVTPHQLRHPYVKHTTKKFITFFEVFRAPS